MLIEQHLQQHTQQQQQTQQQNMQMMAQQYAHVKAAEQMQKEAIRSMSPGKVPTPQPRNNVTGQFR
jgi:hypothetical protein